MNRYNHSLKIFLRSNGLMVATEELDKLLDVWIVKNYKIVQGGVVHGS